MATEFVTADPGSGGSNFAMDTETVGTVSVVHPISKIEWGPEDAFTLVNTGTASLPMQGAAAENAAVAGNPVLVAGRYDSSARTLGDGDAGAVALDASGQMLVSGTLTVGNTVTVASHAVTNAGTFAVQAVQSGAYNITNISGTVSLPTGAATAAKQPALGTAGSASSDVITVQGVASMTPILVNATGSGDVPITLAGETVVLGAGSAAIGKLAANSGVDIGDVDVMSVVPGTGATNLGKAEDAAHSSGDVGVMALGVRNDALDALAGADGDYAPLQVNALGAAFVQPAPAASGGLTISRQIDVDETEDEISSSACQLYFISAQTVDATPLYLHFYNATAASVTVGTTTPLMTYIIPAQSDGNGAGLLVEVSMGIPFSTAMSIAATTTVGGTTGPGANECIVTVGYKA